MPTPTATTKAIKTKERLKMLLSVLWGAKIRGKQRWTQTEMALWQALRANNCN